MASGVPSVVNAFAIMRALAHGRALTLSEVAQQCGISPSTCLGLLRTLVAEGVLHSGASKRYALSSPWAKSIESDVDGTARLITSARPSLERAARAWRAPVGLWQLVSNVRVQLVALGEDTAATRIHMEEGQRQPMGGGSVGRAFAASQNLQPSELARHHAEVRWQRPVSFSEYAESVDQARVRGWSIDDGSAYAGITSLAVTLPQTPAIFCLSASVFAGSRTDCELAALGRSLMALAAELTTAT